MTLLLLLLQTVPWYLFPGSGATKNAPAETPKDTVEVIPAITPEAAMPRDSVVAPKDTFRLNIPETIKVSVLLPFQAGTGYNEGAVDFYSGLLLASKNLGDEGIKLEINAYDTSSGVFPEGCFEADIILGPIGKSELEAASKPLPNGKWLVSPLEPRAASLCDSLRVIHLPSSTRAQYLDLAEWAASEFKEGDRLFILMDPAEKFADAALLTSRLDGLGVKYTVKGDLSEFNNPDTAESLRSGAETFRFIIASENDYFLGECIRKVRVMSMLKFGVALYAPSKVRSIETINVEHLHNCSARISSTYFIDYTDPEVRRFVYTYRSLFRGEPNSFAFDGYDTLKYFVSICMKYGKMWPLRITEFRSNGIQMNFGFDRKEKTGAINTATVRFIYEPDYSVRKVQ